MTAYLLPSKYLKVIQTDMVHCLGKCHFLPGEFGPGNFKVLKILVTHFSI